MKKLQLMVAIVIIIGSVCVGLYLLVKSFKKKDRVRLKEVNRDYKYSKGIITYKGHSLTVKYKIGGQVLEFKGGWDSNPSNLKEGDSVSFRYSSENPGYIITELEKEY